MSSLDKHNLDQTSFSAILTCSTNMNSQNQVAPHYHLQMLSKPCLLFIYSQVLKLETDYNEKHLLLKSTNCITCSWTNSLVNFYSFPYDKGFPLVPRRGSFVREVFVAQLSYTRKDQESCNYSYRLSKTKLRWPHLGSHRSLICLSVSPILEHNLSPATLLLDTDSVCSYLEA